MMRVRFWARTGSGTALRRVCAPAPTAVGMYRLPILPRAGIVSVRLTVYVLTGMVPTLGTEIQCDKIATPGFIPEIWGRCLAPLDAQPP